MSRLTSDERLTLESYNRFLNNGQKGGRSQIASDTGLSQPVVRRHLRKLRDLGEIPESGDKKTGDFQAPQLPDQERSLDDILSHRKDEFKRNSDWLASRKLIPIKINLDGPIGITHIGDPHVDNPGCDIAQLERHLNVINDTEGMLGANVGDAQDNWIGRLANLYESTTVTKAEAWKLVEWMVNRVDWLYLIGGNHDVWSGGNDPLKWIVGNREKFGIFENHAVRLNLKFPNGKAVRVNARHDFPGHSQWNAGHGLAKAAKMGARDHVLVCGHKHVSAVGVEKCPQTGLISHLLRVATYKTVDDYAIKSGFPDGNISPAAVTIIDPQYADDDPRLITVLHDVEEAAEYLTWKRGRAK